MNLLSQIILLSLHQTDISYGYKIMQRLSVMGYSYQQIYRELANLERKGFVLSKTEVRERRQDRVHYRLTDIGYCKINELLSTPIEVSDFKKTKGAHKAMKTELTTGMKDLTYDYVEYMMEAEKAFFERKLLKLV